MLVVEMVRGQKRKAVSETVIALGQQGFAFIPSFGGGLLAAFPFEVMNSGQLVTATGAAVLVAPWTTLYRCLCDHKPRKWPPFTISYSLITSVW